MSAAECGQGRDILTVPFAQDNLCYIVGCAGGGEVCVIDPGEADPVARVLEEQGLTPGWILITHRHRDHLAGVDVLRQRFGCRVMGSAEVTEVALDRVVTGGERLELGDVVLDVMATPGHTEGHLAYVSSGLVGPSLFSGDALFLAGCGRVAAGQASDMWGSLNRLRVLAASTVVYPGHDYLADNLQFSLSLEPGNAEVQRALAGDLGLKFRRCVCSGGLILFCARMIRCCVARWGSLRVYRTGMRSQKSAAARIAGVKWCLAGNISLSTDVGTRTGRSPGPW